MRVTILTVGSRGDVQPYVALGLGLRGAGHTVRVATHASFEGFVRGHGLEFAPLGGDPRALLETDDGRAWLDSGGNGPAFVYRFSRLVGRLAATGFDESLRACAGADAILGSVFAFAAESVAEYLGVPYGRALLQPLDRTRRFPAVGVPRSLGPWHDLATHVVAEQILWQPVRRPLNRWRRAALGLPPRPFLGPAMVPKDRRPPTFYGFSPAVVPPPADWPPSAVVTGYWSLPTDPNWRPPVVLEAFLAAGPAPVAIGFGSMTARDPEALLAAARAALRRSGRRGVLLAGWSGLGIGATAVSDDLYLADELPHGWLFPRVAAAVHHGGAGTTGASLAAGVPTVVVPFFADQPCWGRRVQALGVGPTPIPARRLTADRLAEAIRATDEPGLRRRAAELGGRIRSEDGVGEAVAAVGRWLGDHG